MANYHIKPYSNIAKIGLDKLDGTECSLNDNSESPDGILIRSTKLAEGDLNEGLKAISRAGVGVNNLPIDVCTKKGIVVFNTPGANANAVKELVLAGLMLSSRNVYASIDFVNGLSHLKSMKELEPFLEENKKSFKGSELAGSTLGVVGLGSIGSQVVKEMSDSELFEKLFIEPRLIKRPFLYKPNKLFLVGFKEEKWAEKLLLNSH